MKEEIVFTLTEEMIKQNEEGNVEIIVPEKEPEHVKEERKVEEAIERMYERSQQDMFNSEDWNWSGLR